MGTEQLNTCFEPLQGNVGLFKHNSDPCSLQTVPRRYFCCVPLLDLNVTFGVYPWQPNFYFIKWDSKG